MPIHSTAIIEKSVEIGDNNDIGPYVIINENTKIGNSNVIGTGTVIIGGTTIGNNNHIHAYVSIGDIPQDLAYGGGESFVKIGNNNVIREFVTIHRGTKRGSETIIGDNNYLMVSSHVAHNCRIGNHVIMVNCASLGGYVEVFDHAFLGAFVVVHQHSRIGGFSICGMLTKVTQDIPPYVMVDGNPALVRGLNFVGLKRKGFNPERREWIKKAFKILYRSGFSLSHSLEELKGMNPNEDIKNMINFIEGAKRGILLKSSKYVNEEE